MNRSARDARRLCGTILSLAVLLSGLALPGYSSSRAARSDGARAHLKNKPGRQDGQSQDSKSIDFTVPQTNKQENGTAQDHEELSGGRIAFASDRDNDFEIYLIDPDGGGLTRITDNPAEDVGPSWSPDGTKIAFVSNRDGNQEIYTMNADGSNPTRLTNNAAADIEPAWSPDGTKIAFVSSRTGNDEVFVMNASDGMALDNLTNNAGDDNNPAWAPSGTLLSFSSNRDGDKTEIYRMNADGSNLIRLTNNTFNDLASTWPMGRITFQSDRDGNDEIYTMNAGDGTNVIRLTNNAAFDLDPARAPDGARVAFVSNRDGATNLDIYVSNADGSGVVRLTSHPNADIDPAIQPLVAAQGTVQFSAAAYSVSEGAGAIGVTVTRTGVTTGGLLVDLFTNSGTASDRSDFTATFRTLEFAAGETSKTVNIPIIDDVFVESDETFSVTLARASGGGLGSPNTAVVTITDNDAAAPTTNPIDTSSFFVRQQYLDFLNREPDAAGLAFWTTELTRLLANCDAIMNAEAKRQCVLQARAQVSTAFFLSTEFQETGLFVIQTYLEAFGRLPTFREFLEDLGAIREGVVIGQPGAVELLASNKREYLDRFVNRDEFRARYVGVSNSNYVNALFTNAGGDPAAEAATRDALITGLNNGMETQATALLKVSQTRSVYNAVFNRAFVLLQYFGYLRRDPDTAGFNFWLNKLNSVSLMGEDVRDPAVALARIRRAQMVEAFIDSAEYRSRFGPT